MRNHIKKPRVRFCWDCGRKLQGWHHTVKMIQGECRTLHESCAEKYVGDDILEEPWEIFDYDFDPDEE